MSVTNRSAKLLIERRLDNGKREKWSKIVDPSIVLVFFEGDAYLLSDLLTSKLTRRASTPSISTQSSSESRLSTPSPPPLPLDEKTTVVYSPPLPSSSSFDANTLLGALAIAHKRQIRAQTK